MHPCLAAGQAAARPRPAGTSPHFPGLPRWIFVRRAAGRPAAGGLAGAGAQRLARLRRVDLVDRGFLRAVGAGPGPRAALSGHDPMLGGPVPSLARALESATVDGEVDLRSGVVLLSPDRPGAPGPG